MRIFKNDFNFQPIKILNEFSSIQHYRYQRDNKNAELNQIQSSNQNSVSLLEKYKQSLSAYQKEEYALTELQNMEFNLSDFTKLYSVLQDIALQYQIGKKEVKTKFFKFLDKFADLFLVEIEIGEKRDEIFELDKEIISRREILKAQPELFSAVNCLLQKGYNENSSLSAFEIIKKDFLNRIPEDDKDYLEDLSKDLDKYKTVKDTLKSLDIKVLMKNSQVDRLSKDKHNLEGFIYSSVITSYFHCILLKAQQVQVKNKFIEIFSVQYLVYSLFCNIAKENLVSPKDKNERKKQKKEKSSKEKKESRKDTM